MQEDSRGTELSNVIRIDDERVREYLGRIVRGTVRLKMPSCGADLRDGDHRALSAPGELGGGIADRDVPGRRVGATGGGYHRGAVGHAGQPRHDRTEAQSSEQPMRNFYRRWAEFMAADDWSQLATWRVGERKAAE
jgi:hypothetical protein